MGRQLRCRVWQVRGLCRFAGLPDVAWLAGLRASARLSRRFAFLAPRGACCKQVEPGGTRRNQAMPDLPRAARPSGHEIIAGQTTFENLHLTRCLICLSDVVRPSFASKRFKIAGGCARRTKMLEHQRCCARQAMRAW